MYQKPPTNGDFTSTGNSFIYLPNGRIAEINNAIANLFHEGQGKTLARGQAAQHCQKPGYNCPWYTTEGQ